MPGPSLPADVKAAGLTRPKLPPNERNKPEVRCIMDQAAEQDRYNVTAAELRQFIEQIEQLEAEKKDIAEQIREVYAESKARGYDQKALKTIIGLRKKDKDEVAEQEAILEVYKEALGMN